MINFISVFHTKFLKMKILEKVLWAVDFDQDHALSLQKVIAFAQPFNSEVVLLHVLPLEMAGSSYQKFMEKKVGEELDNMKRSLTAGGVSRVETMIVYGSVVDRIVDVSEKMNVNFVVVNTGSDKQDKPSRLGLNAQKVIRISRKPCGVISECPMAEKRVVVCPVDGSAPSALALKNAILFAKKTGSELKVITVFEPLQITSQKLLSTGVDEEAENKRRLTKFRNDFQAFLTGFDFLNLEYKTELLTGTPHKEIIKFVRDGSILIMGSHGRSGLHRAIIGSVTERVLREVPCNLIVTKTEELFKLRIPTDIEDLGNHFTRGIQLADLGYLEEAINEFHICLNINDMHLPSMKYLSELYEKLGNSEQVKYYDDMRSTIMSQLMNRKIEAEVRKHFRMLK